MINDSRPLGSILEPPPSSVRQFLLATEEDGGGEEGGGILARRIEAEREGCRDSCMNRDLR